MIFILFQLIILDVFWVMGWKVATAENMILEKVGEWGEKQVEKGNKIWDGLIVCPWCLPHLHGLLFVVPLAFVLEIIPTHWEWWYYAAMYPFFVCGACFISGMLWDWHLLIERKKDYYEAAAHYNNAAADAFAGAQKMRMYRHLTGSNQNQKSPISKNMTSTKFANQNINTMYTPKKLGGGSAPVSRKRTVSRKPISDNMSVNVKKIENGFLVSESGYTGKGRNQKYFSRDTYYATNPLISVPGPNQTPTAKK